jgi:hypothetical protein
MEFLAHRGLWFDEAEKNSLHALYKCLDKGFGLETDIRDLNGQLVISHDMPMLNSAIPLEQLLRYYNVGGFKSTLALNIKSDGLQERLRSLLDVYNITNYFVFDMSVPDTLGYLDLKLRTFIRRSDIEHYPELELFAGGIWLDELIEPWISAESILDQSTDASLICIVSSELHRRNYLFQWTEIARAVMLGCSSNKLLLCTDIPHEAEKFFI